jgi:rhodanese-related sulfurtransferase
VFNTPLITNKTDNSGVAEMRKRDYVRYLLIIMFGAGLLGYLIVNSWCLIRASYKNISVDQLDEMMNNKDFILIEVHVPYKGEMLQTDLLIPLYAIENFRNRFPDDKHAKIVLYYFFGQMGRIAAEDLSSVGYTQAYSFQDGMGDRERNGRQILSKVVGSKSWVQRL